MNILRRMKSQLIGASALALDGPLTPTAYAANDIATTNTTMNSIVTQIIGVVLQIFMYIGIILLVWSIGMLILAFKNEDADSKSRAIMLMVVSIALIALRPLVTVVVNATGVLSL